MLFAGSRRRLEALEQQVRELEDAYRRVTELEANWHDWLHKIRNVLARLNQRERDAAEPPPARRPAINPAAARILGFPNHEE